MPWPPSAAKCAACRSGRIGKESSAAGVWVCRRIGEGREEREEVHAHRRQALSDGLVVLEEERFAPAGRRELVELVVGLEALRWLAWN